ncbi:hypothetical protein ZOSMA_21G00450 [Zostera marina]|uniref:Uncharacterized protein n=1 Tax=Zostera marina TaxID=29655 RepID=A0A0K9PJR1_ZOSMR|nr:hypothetical protein ZOSMA_21G00450 [Zostera marina]
MHVCLCDCHHVSGSCQQWGFKRSPSFLGILILHGHDHCYIILLGYSIIQSHEKFRFQRRALCIEQGFRLRYIHP